MEVKYIPFRNLSAKESKYLFVQTTDWEKEDMKLNALANSIKNKGLQEPLLIHKSGDVLHLVDGFKRAVVAENLGIENIPCCFLPVDIPMREVLALLLAGHNETISSSLVT